MRSVGAVVVSIAVAVGAIAADRADLIARDQALAVLYVCAVVGLGGALIWVLGWWRDRKPSAPSGTSQTVTGNQNTGGNQTNAPIAGTGHTIHFHAPTAAPPTPVARLRKARIAEGDGATVRFHTPTPYEPESLSVTVDGIDQTGAMEETDPPTGEFTLNFAPTGPRGDSRGEYIDARWQEASSGPKGEPRTGIRVSGSDNEVRNNTVSGYEQGVSLEGERNVASGNTVYASPPYALVENEEPPPEWGAQFFKGKPITRCPWDDFQTTNSERFNEHLETHSDPPVPQNWKETYGVPQPWAKQAIHYLGDGTYTLPGVPADRDHTLYVNERYVPELVASGLYEQGPAAKQEHVLADAGPPPVCRCGHVARNTVWFQTHLQENGVS